MSFVTGGIAPVAALERTQHLSGTFDFGGPISTLPPQSSVPTTGAGNPAQDTLANDAPLARRAVAQTNSEGDSSNTNATGPAPVTSAPAPHTHTTSDITDAAARAGANAAIKQQGPAVATELLKGSGFDAATSARMVAQTGAPTLLKGMAAGSTLSPTGPKPTSDIQSFMDKAAADNQKLTGVATPTGAPKGP